MKRVRVLVADDHTIVRQGVVSLLEASGDCQVVAQASDGIEAVEQALATRPDVAVLDIGMPRLSGLEAVRDLHAGRGHFGPYAARVLAEQVHQPRRDLDDPYGRLTAREREVFHLLIEGRTSKEVARDLGISTKTAENHRANVLDKLGARNTADVVRYAVRRGLLD
jgi:DNA-binding NarL/FixJ family response regulator